MQWKAGASSPSKLSASNFVYLKQCVSKEKLMARKWHIDEQPWLIPQFSEFAKHSRISYKVNGWKPFDDIKDVSE